MSTEFDAQEILRRTAAAYRLFETYQDAGYVYSISHPGSPLERHSTMAFRTVFQRPNHLRFEWRERDVSNRERVSVICYDGHTAYERHFGRGQTEIAENLNSIVAGATGVSHGAAHTIPALLLDEISGVKLTGRRPIEFVDTEMLAGEECYRLRHEAPHEIDMWISTSRQVVLKLFEQYDVGTDADPHLIIESEKFRSFSGFFRWWRLRKFLKTRDSVREPFHVIDQTFYTDVQVNAAISNRSFVL